MPVFVFLCIYTVACQCVVCVCVCVICVHFTAFVNIHRTLRIAFVRCVLAYSVHVYCIDLQYVCVCTSVMCVCACVYTLGLNANHNCFVITHLQVLSAGQVLPQ